METHVKVVGWLHILFGALGMLVGLALLMFFGGIAGFVGMSGEADAHVAVPVIGMLGVFLFAVLFLLSIPGIIAGYGLITFRPWGRVLGIVVSALELIHVPFGTALGIYSLWVLLSNEGTALFESRHNVVAASYMK